MLKTKDTNKVDEALIQEMFEVGAHFGYSKAKRHSSAKPFIFGAKGGSEIIDLEHTSDFLEKALIFVKEVASSGGSILFVGSKPEAKGIVLEAATSIDMPSVTERWIGGTLTNFPEIKKRVAHLKDLTDKKEKGELSVYTKKERLLINREMDKLNRNFSGIISMDKAPTALFVVDAKHEEIAVTEAKKSGIPVISLSSSDCNLKEVDYPILANDSSVSSVKFFIDKIVDAYKKNLQVEVAEVKEVKKD